MYFDYLASTPLDPRVELAMRPLWQAVGNPSSVDHAYGLQAADAVAMATKQVQQLLPGADGKWIFTSGATEANNLALKGIADSALFGAPELAKKNRILVSAIEHPCVLETVRYLARRGIVVEYLPVTHDGALDLGTLEKSMDSDVICVSVMWANNETGVIQPIGDIARLCRARGVLFHSDAAQAAGMLDLLKDCGGDLPDFISFSGHKIYGPQGIGALYCGKGREILLAPQMHGGGQQGGFRSGTLPVALIAGLGAAAECVVTDRTHDFLRLKTLRDRFETGLRGAFPDLRVNGAASPRLPHASHFQIPGVDMGDLLSALPDMAVARGAACSTGAEKISHVLAAMRMEFFAQECLRVSFGRMTTDEEADALLAALIEIAGHIRNQSGFSA